MLFPFCIHTRTFTLFLKISVIPSLFLLLFIFLEFKKERLLKPDQVFEWRVFQNHTGDRGVGHYTAFAKNCVTSTWFKFDDSSTSSCKVERRTPPFFFSQYLMTQRGAVFLGKIQLKPHSKHIYIYLISSLVTQSSQLETSNAYVLMYHRRTEESQSSDQMDGSCST